MNKSTLRISVYVTIYLLMASVSMAAIFEKDGKVDPREKMDTVTYPQLNAIGQLKLRGTFTVPPRSLAKDKNAIELYKNGKVDEGDASGWLINECLVMTNHHTVYMDRAASKENNITIEFFAGSKNNTFSFRSSGHVVAAGDFTANSRERNNDWAIVKLNTPAPRQWKIEPDFIDYQTARENSAMTASYYQDLDKTKNGAELWGEKLCDIYAKGKAEDDNIGVWLTDCAGIPGASGAPVFMKIGNSFVAYGIMQSAPSFNKFESEVSSDLRNLNRMIPFVNMMSEERLNQIIADNSCNSNSK